MWQRSTTRATVADTHERPEGARTRPVCTSRRSERGSGVPFTLHVAPHQRRGGTRTVAADLAFLSSIFNFLRRHKLNGKRVLSENPLHDVEWAREANVRRPVASHHRFTETLKHIDPVDPSRRLRCMLSLARYTGRRESAICKLCASDFLRDPDAIRAALGFDENSANHMPHGAIRWRDEHDK